MSVDFNSIDSIKSNSFSGFISIAELQKNINKVPKIMGVYLILYTNKIPPVFLENGTGGYFKGKNPNVSIDVLKKIG